MFAKTILGRARLLLNAAFFLGVAAAFGQSTSSVTLAWNRSSSSSVTGYGVYYGSASETYTNHIDVGNVTNATIAGLRTGTTYFFAAVTYGSGGMESAYSSELGYTPSAVSAPSVALTAPANGSSYTAPASISLAATVSTNGHTITKVQFYNGASLLAEVTNAPYSFTWKNVAAGAYPLNAKAIYDAGSVVSSSTSSVTVTNPALVGLPAPWQTVDIGSPGATGSASVSNGIYIVTGAGAFGRGSDSFRFLYQPMSGDGEIRVRVNSLQNTGSSARVGVIIRETLTTNSRYAFAGLSPDGTIRWQTRRSTSGRSSTTNSGTGTPPNIWVRLVRSGSTVTAYSSTDGSNWTQIGSTSISMAANIYFGFAVASGQTGVLATSTLSSPTLVP
ncbi:MAG: Ig-like domain-containing protein [Limisphaerales bacterium]